MKIDTFLTLYNSKHSKEDREKLVKAHMINKQISFTDKADRAELIAQNSYHQNKIGPDGVAREIFHQNSAAKYMLYSLTLVDLYTDLEVDFKKSVEVFEKINGELLDLIIDAIDERELKEFRMLLEFACDDIVVNEYELHSFIAEQVERFGDLIGNIIIPVIDGFDVNKFEDILKQFSK